MQNYDEETPLWIPSVEQMEASNVKQYMNWLQETKGLHFQDYQTLWTWSVENGELFWASLWEYFNIQSSVPYTHVLEGTTMPDFRWFTDAKLNYAEHIFQHAHADKTAIMYQSEQYELSELSYAELRKQVSSVAHALQEYGVQSGDTVVAYMPNIPQTVIAFLACASLGAVWSSCSPDFGTHSVIDRFQQISPKVLIAVDGYQYNGKKFDRRLVVKELQEKLPTLKKTILVPYLQGLEALSTPLDVENWHQILQRTATHLNFEQVPFNHPLWVLYSSGTTGIPKAIVHGHGGMLLEHLKVHYFHCDVKPDDRFFWFTTTGWMMWNFLIGALLGGCTILMYDGSPSYPSLDVMWEFAERTKMTFFGTSAGYLTSCMKNHLKPGEKYDLSALRRIGSTGSPLTADGFFWVYDAVKQDVQLGPSSGGTDVCTAFVGANPLDPVYAGEMQCRYLGVCVEAFNEQGHAVYNEVGELVITKPMPSMPLYFWGDEDRKRYRESYFDMFPGVWRHGDWILIRPDGRNIIYGRSDSTINRFGVRMGTSEIYQAVESVHEVVDSLVIDLELLGRESSMLLFVVLQPDITLDEELIQKIYQQVRTQVSPRHVPDKVYQVTEIPRTLNGKKLEVPIRKLLLGYSIEKAVNPDSMANPDALQFFIDLAADLNVKS